MIPSHVLRRSVVVVIGSFLAGGLFGCAARRANLSARRAAPPVATATVPSAPEAHVPATVTPWGPPQVVRVDVRQADGSPADFAEVTLEGPGTSLADLTDERGRVLFTGVPNGMHAIRAMRENQESELVRVDVLPFIGTVVELPMRRATTSEQMVIASSSTADLVDAREATPFAGEFLSKVPLANRNVQDVVAMMPGVIRVGGSDSTEISIGGGTGAQARQRIGGASAKPVIDGGLTAQVPAGAVESFRLITSSASARYGEQSTGVAEIVKRGRKHRREAEPVLAFAPPPPTAPPATTRTGAPAPHPRSGERYRHLDENAFRSPLDAPLSTFGIDVDTASYSIARSWLEEGRLPPPDAVRVEEFVNSFRYADAAPRDGDAFALTAEVAECPWAPEHELVRVAIQGARVDERDAPPANLVFLVDVSGSMQAANKLPLVQSSLRLLVERLRPEDTVGLVVYAGAAGVVLEPTSGARKDVILSAIDRLSAGGSTAGAAGIEAAYALAERHFREGGSNRVLLATDGDFNVGPSSDGELVRLIETKREKGVFLTVLGFGTGNYQDAKMEQLADHGNGNYAYVDDLDEGRRVLVAEGSGTLVTIAKDVKIQVEMNPARVARYRLLGYENRLMPDEDFADDTKDGGEIGAGHAVTALYEIVPARRGDGARRAACRLRYQEGPEPSAKAASGELMTVQVRWKLPDETTSDVAEIRVADDASSFGRASGDLRWSAAAAAFAMKLQDSPHLGGLEWSDLRDLAEDAVGDDPDGRRAAMVGLIGAAAALQPVEVGSMGR